MRYLAAYKTDVGIKRISNQDSLCIKEAETEAGCIFFAAVCDGMGGLEQGEVASEQMTLALSAWFDQQLPVHLACTDPLAEIRYSWERLIQRLNQELTVYGKQRRIAIGTTVTALLLLPEGSYLIGHVGDTRVYRVSDGGMVMLTEDQTVVAREVQQGKLTAQEAEADPRRNVLLQCVGASRVVEPAFYTGRVQPGESYLICSDGFRHVLSPQEMEEALQPSRCTEEGQMEQTLAGLIALAMERQEADNITAILIRTAEG